MAPALERLCDRAEEAVHGGYNIIILSDRQIGPDRIAIPALLATAAVHHHLIRKGLRTSVGLVVEPANRAKCTISAVSRAMAPKRSTPIWPFDTLLDMHAKGEFPPEVDRYEVVSATSSRSARAS
jgi:glutamate synthase (NADPH/NADH) large chain